MRKLLAVAVLGSFVAFTASAALAEGNADPKFFQFPEHELVTSTTDTVQGVVAGPVRPQRVFVSADQNRENNSARRCNRGTWIPGCSRPPRISWSPAPRIPPRASWPVQP